MSDLLPHVVLTWQEVKGGGRIELPYLFLTYPSRLSTTYTPAEEMHKIQGSVGYSMVESKSDLEPCGPNTVNNR